MNKDDILNCIRKAEENPSEINGSVLTGLSGARIVSLLKNFSEKIVNEKTTYLEVGVFQGLTLLSVAGSVVKHEVFGIDNFAFFDIEGKNLAIINDRMERLGIHNARIINEDFEDALEHLDKFTGNKKVGLFFIDGPHDYRSQLMCLLLIKPWLSEDAVIVIDDSNYLHVRQANNDFLKTNPVFRLIFQTYTKAHPSNLTGNEKVEAEAGWWNGLNVIVRDREDIFEPFYPPVLKDKTIFTNDHNIHSARYPEAFRKYSLYIDIIESVKRRRSGKALKGKFRSLNTFSDDLDGISYNPSFLKENEQNLNEAKKPDRIKFNRWERPAK